MPDINAQIKKVTEAFHGSNNITKFIDGLWEINRCRSEMMRKVESTPDINRPMNPARTPSSTKGESVYQEPTFDHDPETPDASSSPTKRASSRRSHRDEHARLQSDNTALSTTSHVGEHMPYIEEPRSDSPPATALDRKRRDSPAPSLTPTTKRRCRGAGKKQKPPAPHFGNERFGKLHDALRQQISEFTILSGLQVAWKLVTAFKQQTASQAQIDQSYSRARQLQCRIVNCDKLELQGTCWVIRATIERRFFQVQLMAEHRRLLRESKNKAQVTKFFREEMYPEQTAAERRTSWDYFSRTATPLYEAVQRYGYGSLIFPLVNVTTKSLHLLTRESDGDFLEYIEMCHPEIDRFLCNLSGFLPRLLTWGLPEAQLAPQIVRVSCEHLVDFTDDSFNSLFYLNGSQDQGRGVQEDIPPWPPQVLTPPIEPPVDPSLFVSSSEDYAGTRSSEAFDAQNKSPNTGTIASSEYSPASSVQNETEQDWSDMEATFLNLQHED